MVRIKFLLWLQRSKIRQIEKAWVPTQQKIYPGIQKMKKNIHNYRLEQQTAAAWHESTKKNVATAINKDCCCSNLCRRLKRKTLRCADVTATCHRDTSHHRYESIQRIRKKTAKSEASFLKLITTLTPVCHQQASIALWQHNVLRRIGRNTGIWEVGMVTCSWPFMHWSYSFWRMRIRSQPRAAASSSTCSVHHNCASRVPANQTKDTRSLRILKN